MSNLIRKSKKGFTLIELMIVVAIIGILAAIAIPNFLRFQLKSKSSEGKVNIAAIRTAEESYLAEFGNYVAAVWLGNDDYRTTNNLTGGTLPTVVWQKFMAYAHTNIEIKPVEGVDFQPAPFVIAETEQTAPDALQLERPPSLKPEAAQKLLDVANRLKAALAAQPAEESKAAALAPSPAAVGAM